MLEGRLYPELESFIQIFPDQFEAIPSNRREELRKISNYISKRVRNGVPASLVFICTHNSRRSHMGQIWAQTAAFYYEIPDVRTFSGGTEATAFHPNAIEAMRGAGFEINSRSKDKNPVYEVSYSEEEPAMKVFSKKYDDAENPEKNFCAIMTCSEADTNCPNIPGADLRIPITYEDPKAYDHTEMEEKAYRERCYQIGLEMFYMLSCIKDH